MRLTRTIGLLALIADTTVGCGSSTEPKGPAVSTSGFPLMTNGGGHVLSPLRLIVIAAQNDDLRDSLFAFAKALPATQWWKTISSPYGISPNATAVTVTGPPIQPGTMQFSDLRAYVQKAAVDSAGFQPDGRTAYVVFLPPGVSCTGGLCSLFGTFHTGFGTADALAVVPRQPAGLIAQMEELTSAASHEIVEAATDPWLDAWRIVAPSIPWEGNPWILDDGGLIANGSRIEENADLCEATRYLEGGFYYQRIFSNDAALLGADPCVPAIATPYYVVRSTFRSPDTRSLRCPIG
jgi:hypothetical protein